MLEFGQQQQQFQQQQQQYQVQQQFSAQNNWFFFYDEQSFNESLLDLKLDQFLQKEDFKGFYIWSENQVDKNRQEWMRDFLEKIWFDFSIKIELDSQQSLKSQWSKFIQQTKLLCEVERQYAQTFWCFDQIGGFIRCRFQSFLIRIFKYVMYLQNKVIMQEDKKGGGDQKQQVAIGKDKNGKVKNLNLDQSILDVFLNGCKDKVVEFNQKLRRITMNMNEINILSKIQFYCQNFYSLSTEDLKTQSEVLYGFPEREMISEIIEKNQEFIVQIEQQKSKLEQKAKIQLEQQKLLEAREGIITEKEIFDQILKQEIFNKSVNLKGIITAGEQQNRWENQEYDDNDFNEKIKNQKLNPIKKNKKKLNNKNGLAGQGAFHETQFETLQTQMMTSMEVEESESEDNEEDKNADNLQNQLLQKQNEKEKSKKTTFSQVDSFIKSPNNPTHLQRSFYADIIPEFQLPEDEVVNKKLIPNINETLPNKNRTPNNQNNNQNNNNFSNFTTATSNNSSNLKRTNSIKINQQKENHKRIEENDDESENSDDEDDDENESSKIELNYSGPQINLDVLKFLEEATPDLIYIQEEFLKKDYDSKADKQNEGEVQSGLDQVQEQSEQFIQGKGGEERRELQKGVLRDQKNKGVQRVNQRQQPKILNELIQKKQKVESGGRVLPSAFNQGVNLDPNKDQLVYQKVQEKDNDKEVRDEEIFEEDLDDDDYAKSSSQFNTNNNSQQNEEEGDGSFQRGLLHQKSMRSQVLQNNSAQKKIKLTHYNAHKDQTKTFLHYIKQYIEKPIDTQSELLTLEQQEEQRKLYRTDLPWISLKQGPLVSAKTLKPFSFKISKWNKVYTMFGKIANKNVAKKLAQDKDPYLDKKNQLYFKNRNPKYFRKRTRSAISKYLENLKYNEFIIQSLLAITIHKFKISAFLLYNQKNNNNQPNKILTNNLNKIN